MLEPSDEWLFRLSVATAASVLVSITAAQILLTVTLVTWLALRTRRINWPGYSVPLLAFMLTTGLSLAMSPDPGIGFGPVRKFVLFSMGVIAATFITDRGRYRWMLLAMVAAAAAVSIVAIAQFGIQYSEFLATDSLADDPTILARVTGLMGHWMTFSGEQMLMWCALLPLGWILGARWHWLLLSLVGTALVLSFTRSVWLGAIAGVVTVALYVPPRRLFRIVVPIAIIAVLVSGLILNRFSMSFSEGGFAPDQARLDMIDVGTRMIWDHPLFGVGPERVQIEFSSYYHGPNLEHYYYGHLHSNFLQVAAERGLLCLAALIWLLVQLGLDLRRRARSPDPFVKWTAVSSLSVLVAFVVAGLFEYNFGDSEVLMLLVFLVSIPYGVGTGQPGQGVVDSSPGNEN